MNGRFLSHAAFGLLSVALGATVLPACDENPKQPPLGDLEVTTSAPSLATELTTADGWVIKWERFLVHVTAVNIAGDDAVLAASATAQIVDQVAPEPKPLLAVSLRTARAWEDVSFQIGPATPDTDIVPVAPVTEADRDKLQAEGLSFLVQASATKNGVVKSLVLGFASDTLHGSCQESVNGVVTRGLIVPTNGKDTANIVMDGSVLFSDDLTMPGATLRAEAIALADANGDNVVTMEELRAVPLDTARAAGGAYKVADGTDVADLGAFLEELTRSTVRSFRNSGSCSPSPVVAAE